MEKLGFCVNLRRRCVRVMDMQGRVRRIGGRVTVAQVMLEEVGHMVASMEEVQRSRCMSGLPAQAKLVAGKSYLLVPVRRLYTRVSEDEMVVLGRRRRRGGGERSEGEKDGVLCFRKDERFGGEMVRRVRRWKPELDTIDEEERGGKRWRLINN